MPVMSRRQFVGTVGVAASALPVSRLWGRAEPEIIGQGDFRYRRVPDWGVLGDKTPVNDCHGLAQDREGHIVLLTNHAANNVIIYDRSGRLVHKWGTAFPGAHGLSLVNEGAREVLFITDLGTHRVAKTTLDGEILNEWRWPEATGKYTQEDQYRPSWTLHLPNGEFFVLDGYGRDYIVRYGSDGSFRQIMGGQEGGIVHWGPHGGMVDHPTSEAPTLLIAMSDQQYLLRLGLDGKKLQHVDLPGGNPRQIRRHGSHYFVAHLGDNWPKDRSSRGFISVLDEKLRVVANLAGSAPVYDDAGRLHPMRHEQDTFIHPHDLLVDHEQSLYVAQYSSNQTYPLKFERL